MKGPLCKSTAIFVRPFTVPGFSETLPAGEYDLETELSAPPNHLDPKNWEASVVVHLHPRASHPGLERNLTVTLANLNSARAKDKLSGKHLADFLLEEMLADPMTRLVMEADGVSEMQIRYLYSAARSTESDIEMLDQEEERQELQSRYREDSMIQTAENEGMPTLAE
ncbi:hypothetical protein AAFO92_09850 [Roseovarius sp. CAU 1744]|uniref:hypothetical protein n=1 Tax=Roseovarius sp. CAU 1744 TaxID=3140368 RepID=UPI00325ACDDB